MSIRTKKVRRPSIFSLERTLRSRLSWTRWRQKRVRLRLEREAKRLRLMQLQLDSQLLLLQELELTEQQLRWAEQELLESSQFRLQGQLPPPPQNPQPPSEMDKLLGLG